MEPSSLVFSYFFDESALGFLIALLLRRPNPFDGGGALTLLLLFWFSSSSIRVASAGSGGSGLRLIAKEVGSWPEVERPLGVTLSFGCGCSLYTLACGEVYLAERERDTAAGRSYDGPRDCVCCCDKVLTRPARVFVELRLGYGAAVEELLNRLVRFCPPGVTR